MKIAIIDLSSIFWRYYHASDGEAVNVARRKTLSFVQSKYTHYDYVKVALDCPPYKRSKLTEHLDESEQYKAGRERPVALIEELKKTIEQILNDGWSVLTCDGAEADDIIASFCAQNKTVVDKDGEFITPEITVYCSDKDLLQCEGENITFWDSFKGEAMTAQDRLGVPANKVTDYQALCGDTSDNIPGVKGIGPKAAIALIEKFGGVHGIIDALEDPDNFKPNWYTKLTEQKGNLILSYNLVTLNTKCEINEEKREVKSTMTDEIETTDAEFDEAEKTETVHEKPEQQETKIVPATETHVVKHEAVSYRQGLEPNGIPELVKAAHWIHESQMYTDKFKNEQSVFAIIMRGREMGIGAITALSEMNIIQGKVSKWESVLLLRCLK
jgi:5'-3' exonuclease